jgi:hypothetical protein
MPKGFDNMCRYVVLLFSVIMLLVTFCSPDSNWPIDFWILGYQIHGNLFYWLFMVSLVVYVPLIVGGTILFMYDASQLIKTKRHSHTVNIFAFSIVTFAALYRFNGWVFEEIF